MLNCTLKVTDAFLHVQKAIYIPTFILGVLGNIYVFVIFCRRPRTDWTYMMVYISNMAIADCVLLVILPIKAYYYNSTLQEHSKSTCNFLLSLYYVNMYVSVFTMTTVSVVRYVAIAFPLKAREAFSCKRALVVCALIWLVVGGFSPVYFLKDSDNDKAMCFQRVKETLSLHFIVLLTVVGFLVPLLIMLYCSIKVIYTLRKQLDVGFRSEKIQCIFIIAANLIVFVICFLPVNCGFVLKYIAQAHEFSCDVQFLAHNFVHGAMCLSTMNCCLDCFSYYFATNTRWNICGINQRNEEYE
nr:G-protein coupled receptor 35.1 [Misgurnus anguillicaudatus]